MLVGIVSISLFVGSASADDKDTKKKDGDRDHDKALTETHFVDMASSAGMTEVIMGKMGVARARNEDVRKFAAKMVEDHSKANMELLSIVSDLRIAVPDKPLPEHEKHLMHFSGDQVKDFDKEYMKMMVDSHEEAVKLFTRASKDLKNDRLKGFAEKTLPVIKGHLEMAKKINDQVGKGDSGDRSGDKGNKSDKDKGSKPDRGNKPDSDK
jgi:putative membrane protein